MDKLLSKVPKARLAILKDAGFVWHPMVAVWANREKRRLITYDAVMKRDSTWLEAWASNPVCRLKDSLWFEQEPTPEALEAILLEVRW